MTQVSSARSTLLLYALLLVSFILHAVTLGVVLQVRVLAKDQLTLLSNQLADMETQTITTTIHVKQDVPIAAAIPINKSVVIPVNTTVNIDQVISVPINTPLGTANINVPLKTSVPINTSVPVTISDTLSISTTVALDLSVPISIALADTPFAALLRNLRQQLRDLNQKF